MWSILPVITCTALGDLHINTKHILAHGQHHYISEMLAKNKWWTIRNGIHVYKKEYYYQRQVQQVPNKQQVPDKWRDACKLPKFIKFWVKHLQKISNRLYIRVCTFDIIYYYQWHVQQVPDKWRDACKSPKCIKFGVVSYNNYILMSMKCIYLVG